MSRLKLVREQFTLVYGLQLFEGPSPGSDAHTRVEYRGPDGRTQSLVLHTISGSRDEVRQQLLQSIDAFLELIEPVAPG